MRHLSNILQSLAIWSFLALYFVRLHLKLFLAILSLVFLVLVSLLIVLLSVLVFLSEKLFELAVSLGRSV